MLYSNTTRSALSRLIAMQLKYSDKAFSTVKMVERQEDPASGKKMKKLEKPQASTNREYLDMDTDEEDFGRQETPEPEEESIPEPEKPVFTEEELGTLVQYVREFTSLPNFVEADWAEGVIELVKEYFRNPAITVLVIFSESRILRVLHDFPEFTDGRLTYFLRTPWQVYTPENFLSTIIFGSIDDDAENSTLKFMENIYAPIAFRSDDWPAVMRNEVFSKLHEFLLCLTDSTYSPMGLTILYVPREGLEEDRPIPKINDDTAISELYENASEPRDEDESEGLVERLERVARYWIRQIREALKVPSSCTESSPCKTIVDEIRYWHCRYENLSCVHHQLTNKSVLSIVKKLENVRSASVKQYNPVVDEVRRMLDEATSNITYLNLLEEFDGGFEIPDGIEDYATRTFLLIRFIGRESPFYNSQEKIETLCQACCTQAVEHCRGYIDLDIVLDGDPNAGREMIVMCIDCCSKLADIYDRLIKMDETQESPTISLTHKSIVFNNVTTFIHRCNDLIGIADARIAFDKCDEEIIIGGPRGLEHGLRYRNIEERFYATLNEIKEAHENILNLVSPAWLDKIAAFKRGIKDIENMVQNWIDDIFQDITNVEEGIEALHGIERFSRRSYLRETLNRKWIQIWKIFGNELESCSILTNNDQSVLRHHPSLPPYSGTANILRSNNVYLARQYGMLIDASDWFGDCDAQTPIIQKYKRVLAALTEKERALFSEWQKELADKEINPSVILSQSIITYNDCTKTDTIRPNLENYYLNHLREISEWTLLNYETKNVFSKDCPKWETLKSRYNNVDIMCKFYNSIVTTISDYERFLFLTLLDNLEATMSPAFNKTTWSSDSFERLLADCMGILTRIRESVESYRKVNCEVDRIMEKIRITSLVNPDASLTDIIEDSVACFEQYRDVRLKAVGKKCGEISKLLLEFKSNINTDEAKTAEYWNYVVTRIYGELKVSLANCVRLSLLCALRLLQDDELTGLPPPNVEIDVTRTAIKAIMETIVGINASAIEKILIFEEFLEVFETSGGIKVLNDFIDHDPESIDLKKDIDAFSI